MRFSLIVCTVDRTSELERLLASLKVQRQRDFELILVDQNPDDRLVPLLKSYENDLSIIHIREQRRGASRARNIGIEHAGGDLLGFPDDDCWYSPGLLEKVLETFVHHPEVDGLTGSLTDTYGRGVMGRFDPEPGRIEAFNVWARGIEATIFLRRSRVGSIWFDECLGVGSGTMWGAGEGTDLLLRLLDDGKLLCYYPDIVIGHPPFLASYDARASRKAYSYGCGMGRVLRNHRTPLRLKARWLVRPLGGTVLSIATFRLAKALFHFSTFRGRLKGLRS